VRISYLVKRLEQAIRQQLDELLRDFDLTAPQYTALSVLRVQHGLSSADLARRSFVSPQSMNEMLTTLERKGLVARAPSPHDRRVLHAELTPKALKVLTTCDHVVDDLEARMLSNLDTRARDAMRKALTASVNALAQK
jgi:DNA-binding MarR family transcriptional regulator